MSKDEKTAQPMDALVHEDRHPVMKENSGRVCWAIKTLNEEVWALFPETPVEYSDQDGRNTALAVTYDLSALDEEDRVVLGDLLMLVRDDARVSLTLLNHDPYYTAVLVSMHSSARTQDNREPFGLATALMILSGNEDGDEDDLFTWEGGDAASTSADLVDGGGA